MSGIFEYVVGDKLNREVYRFFLRGSTEVVLRIYAKEERPTPRHGWKAVLVWNRIFMRKSSPPPPVPPEVSEAAVEHFRSQIVFKSE